MGGVSTGALGGAVVAIDSSEKLASNELAVIGVKLVLDDRLDGLRLEGGGPAKGGGAVVVVGLGDSEKLESNITEEGVSLVVKLDPKPLVSKPVPDALAEGVVANGSLAGVGEAVPPST